jgi:transcriptional regulator with XRE-family HTH domain
VTHSHARELAATLRRLRDESGLSGVEAARRARLTQTKVSRLETGRQVPTVKEVAALCKAYRVAQEVRDKLMALAEDMEAGTTSSRIVLQNPARLQGRIGRIEMASRVLRSLQTTMVIGMAQTPRYAVAITEPDLVGEKREEAVRARLARQSALDSDRRLTLLHTEGALRWHLQDPSLMADQIDHLTELSMRPNVRMGVIPWDRPTGGYVRHGFHLYDSSVVVVTTELGMAFITDPKQVKIYEKRFSEIEAAAVFDDEARAVFARLAGEYRDLTTADPECRSTHPASRD